MYCTNCGSQVSENERFCGQCGVELVGVNQPRVTPQPTHQPTGSARSNAYMSPSALVFIGAIGGLIAFPLFRIVDSFIRLDFDFEIFRPIFESTFSSLEAIQQAYLPPAIAGLVAGIICGFIIGAILVPAAGRSRSWFGVLVSWIIIILVILIAGTSTLYIAEAIESVLGNVIS